MSDAPVSRAEFKAELEAAGQRQYHDLHPFHQMLHGGELDRGQVQARAS